MELKDMMELWDRFDRSRATEMELSYQDVHFKLKQDVPAVAAPATQTVVVPQAGGIVAAPAPAGAPAAGTPEAADASAATDDETAIKAPLAGTFYRASSPEADAFVSVGQMVHKGDVIGIIEAMKLYNEVQADKEGVIQEILAEDGQLVEYHQVLMTVG